jgi:dTDP-glucose 4,6-dehydratase
MKRTINNILITGGAGFIGTNLIRYIFSLSDFRGRIINVDKLTYAGNLSSLDDIMKAYPERYVFSQTDINDSEAITRILRHYDIDTIIHLAAESHVDRSIYGPGEFVKTNIIGTFSLLDCCRNYWDGRKDLLFHHVSTDEVFGSLGDAGFFTEATPYDPRSPYSASKAASDHLVRAYYHTYAFPITLSNCSNNYGPYQFPEKLIPLMIENMLVGKPLPIYGDGKNVRDWLYVEDHSSAIWTIVNNGKVGESYNIGGENEWENIRLVEKLCELTAEETGQSSDNLKDLISFVKDRPGHDRRYAIDCSKIKRELGWIQEHSFEEGLRRTVQWYLGNRSWVDSVKTGAYREWMKKNYTII